MLRQIMKRFGWIILVLSVCTSTGWTQGRDTAQLWQAITRDGNTYLGQILTKSAQELRLQTTNLGPVTIQLADVVRLSPLTGAYQRQGRWYLPNPIAERYLFQSSAYPQAKGTVNYQNVLILFNQVNVGVSRNFSLGLGGMPLFLFGGTPSPLWVAPRLSFPIQPERWYLGGGAFIGTAVGAETGVFGYAYGLTTVGSPDRQVSVGLGYGFAGGSWSELPAFLLSGLLRLSPKTYLLSENYLLGVGDSNFYLLSVAGRSAGPRLSLDYGLVLPGELGTGSGSVLAIPYLGLAVQMGRGARN